MEKFDIIKTFQAKIATQVLNMPQKTIQPDEALITSGLIDSFSLVDLAMLVEDGFNVRIDDTELNADTFDTLEQLAAIIVSRI
jgi:acyl carrier protein